MKDRAKGKKEKAVVFGMINRDTKQALVLSVVDAKANTLQKEIYNNIKEDSILIIDESKAYHPISTYAYDRKVVNHSKGEYAKKSSRTAYKIHTNSIEGFRSQLKRGINGIYRWISRKRLQAYLNEFSYRYNAKAITDFERFNNWFVGCESKKLVYSNLVG